jgi:hypothetical protein
MLNLVSNVKNVSSAVFTSYVRDALPCRAHQNPCLRHRVIAGTSPKAGGETQGWDRDISASVPLNAV